MNDFSFPFTDLHSFKNYIIFAQTYLPDRFPPCDWRGPDQQWNFDRAFEGLRYGLKLAIEEKGERREFSECQKLVEEAYHHYHDGQTREGFFKLEEVHNLLKKTPSQ